jgi:hypothetical protein
LIRTLHEGILADGIVVPLTKLCAWFGVLRRTVYYKPTKATPKIDHRFAEPIKAMIEKEPSFGYRTVAWLLGFNKNTVQRIFQGSALSGNQQSAFCFFRKALRQPNNCGGEIPRRRASAETFTPGSNADATACALNSSDHRRRSPTGAPSKRSITASTNCKLPVADIGVELLIGMKPRHQNNASSLSQTGHAANPRGLLAAYVQGSGSSSEHLSETSVVLRSIPGIGPVASSMLIAEMPEIDTITGE